MAEKTYGKLVIELDLSVMLSKKDEREMDLSDPECQDYLETNTDHSVQSIINYAKSREILINGKIVGSSWHWR